MRAGRLNHAVEILAPADTVDAGGAVLPSAAPATAWRAAIEPESTSEPEVAAQAAGRLRLRLRMRFFAGLSASHRIRMIDHAVPGRSRTFDLAGPPMNPDGRRREHLLDVVEAPV